MLRRMYRQRRSVIPGAVVWQATASGPGHVLPDGCMDLIFTGGEVMVAGPDTRPYELADSAGERYDGIRFFPGVLPNVLGIPAAELRDERVPLHAMLDSARARACREQVGQASRPGIVLESFARSYPCAVPDTRTVGIVRMLGRGVSVREVAGHANLTARQLHRWSLRQLGYGSKTLARILRFQAALRLAATEPSDTAIATRAGYSDQAHLIRESRQLAGSSFAALVR